MKRCGKKTVAGLIFEQRSKPYMDVAGRDIPGE